MLNANIWLLEYCPFLHHIVYMNMLHPPPATSVFLWSKISAFVNALW
jgi:hypothetical protein